MTPETFTATASNTSEALLQLLETNADEIVRDWENAEADAAENNKKHVPIKLSFSILISPQAGTRKHKLSWGVRKSSEALTVDEDPSQPSLPGVAE